MNKLVSLTSVMTGDEGNFNTFLIISILCVVAIIVVVILKKKKKKK